MRKGHWLALGAALVLGISGYQVAGANPADDGFTPGYGYGNCRNMSGPETALSPEDRKARKLFLAETAALRRQLVTKQGELTGLLAQTNPDEKKVAGITGELYDLREQLRQEAADRGLPGGFGIRNCGNEGPGRGLMGRMHRGAGGPHQRW